jgi:hypothetical protein
MKISLTGKGRISIDGRHFVGRSVQINGDKVVIDGIEQSGSLVGPISIAIHGNVEKLESSAGSVTVNGSAGSVSTSSGSIKCGDVSGNVSTTSGGVTCGKIAGNATTVSGNIKRSFL